MRSIFVLSSLLFSQSLLAGDSLWTEIESNYQFRTERNGEAVSHTARKMQLDFQAIKQHLTTASRGTSKATTIELPSPDGKLVSFRVENDSVMSPALAARYPNIKTWKIINTQNPEITGRIDIGPRGFHGLFHTNDGDRVFIDPEYQGNDAPQTEIYTILSSRENRSSSHSSFTCTLHDHGTQPSVLHRLTSSSADDKRTYRLALAVTGEYTQLFGGTKVNALAGMTTTVNRLNQVFERDLNIKLELIDNTDDLIYTSPSTDPFSNQNAVEMVNQNLVNTKSVIGRGNYDIGHVFGTGNTGGLAFLNSTCGENKAGGVTGSNSPDGEAFNIDYVAHEIGHQLGASHTFNGFLQNCNVNNRVQNSAVEPGSGSSIMGYAGICGNDDLQSNSDAFFHSHSIRQIRQFTHFSGGSHCGTVTASNNNNPGVEAGESHSIPAQTPFVLTGDSSDVDGDPILHSWEQIDTGASADLYTDLMNNPLFRVWSPTTKAERYFPRLEDLLNNTSTLGELLPSTNRELNFSLIARDNKGGISSDSVKLNVIPTGSPFAVTSQSIPTELAANQSFMLNWNVAGTNQVPINCNAVNVGFISENGNSSLVLSNTPNDGSQLITLPNDVRSADNVNIQVACSNNIFFAVSKTKHSVKGSIPALSLAPPALLLGDQGINTLKYTIQLSDPAAAEVTIFYQATSTVVANRDTQIQGDVVIPVGQTSIAIRIPVIEETVELATNAAQLAIKTSEEAAFELAESFIATEALQVSANPSPVEALAGITSDDGGAGAFDTLFGLAFFLLLLTRFSSTILIPSHRKPI